MSGLRNLLVSLVLVLAGCGGSPGGGARSPSTDYRPAPAQTSDGDVVGADRQSPDDKLATGPRGGSGGPTAAGTPGPGNREPPPAKPTPCRDIGLEDADGKSRCARSSAPSGGKSK